LSKSQIKVQVANGSTTAGVASAITSTLQAQGWDTLPAVNATSQVTASEVFYAPDRKSYALEIASQLHLKSSVVVPLTASVPVPGAAGDDVVVIVGPDLAS